MRSPRRAPDMSPEPDPWSAPYRVRFDEAGPDGCVRTSVLLRYAQDVAWHHSTVRGYDRAWYAARGLAWLVRTAQVAVLAPIAVGAELVATTRVVGWRRVWARRGTEFRAATGALVATAQIDWVLLDARGAPTRIPAEFEPVFGASAGGLALARVELAAAPHDAPERQFFVRPQELDPMGHVNNAVYADWLEEAIAEAGSDADTRATPRLARLEYAAPADRGGRLSAQCWPADAGWSYRLRDAAGVELLRARLDSIQPTTEPS
jgi:acyl-CoA thioesterase FadM